ncbi:DUF3015 domain-containing protein [Leptospira gomenensis]|uniref:DUF3015 domain-containing protein n=1 Tax=Leptospira gomenensis TaxID=2484974 RepID=A0A5F1Y9M3_9LEPT|nr:DUF3015 domain-containing protein [Leptospira gomenensis]TGK31497.1 DUF3015 domain-containing protein [Leptospira gomenensis]TGK32487.1 DUF3015 domain-containing protein [Leptospira gomenensis]TGK46202.1 DUF3015 domain-containing protein [Leptospira gomenensis]TGK54727.1 DUF3015 domain-containing protein [Leptospira gomenensis]
MKKLIAIALTSLFVLSSNLSAKPAYGMAGCGLGSLIIKDNGFVQIFAATSNGFYYNQSFGMTSGTSNCTTDGIVNNDKAKEIFVHMNYESLEQEIAMGKGEKLSSLATLFGCSADSKRFKEVAKENYSKIFTTAAIKNPSVILSNLEIEVGKDAELKSSCKI